MLCTAGARGATPPKPLKNARATRLCSHPKRGRAGKLPAGLRNTERAGRGNAESKASDGRKAPRLASWLALRGHETRFEGLRKPLESDAIQEDAALRPRFQCVGGFVAGKEKHSVKKKRKKEKKEKKNAVLIQSARNDVKGGAC